MWRKLLPRPAELDNTITSSSALMGIAYLGAHRTEILHKLALSSANK